MSAFWQCWQTAWIIASRFSDDVVFVATSAISCIVLSIKTELLQISKSSFESMYLPSSATFNLFVITSDKLWHQQRLKKIKEIGKNNNWTRKYSRNNRWPGVRGGQRIPCPALCFVVKWGEAGQRTQRGLWFVCPPRQVWTWVREA